MPFAFPIRPPEVCYALCGMEQVLIAYPLCLSRRAEPSVRRETECGARVQGKNPQRSGAEPPTQGTHGVESIPLDPSMTRRVPLGSRPVATALCAHNTPRADCLAGCGVLTADRVR